MYEDKTEKLKESAEKVWEATRKSLQTAGFRANQYKLIVQKKIDLNALHKKIASAHADLGRIVDEERNKGLESLLERDEIKTLFGKLDTYKDSAAALEEEIEKLKVSTPPGPEPTQEEDRP
ncbi:MAG: hypothetical protein WDA20_00965 [Desulfuromonadales bacterium]